MRRTHSAELRAVTATRRKEERREQPIDIAQGAAADERERAAAPLYQPREMRSQIRRHQDRIGRERDIQKRAVDVEE
jgi:hypothetical protein